MKRNTAQHFDLVADEDFADLVGVTPKTGHGVTPKTGHGGKREGAGGTSKAYRAATKDPRIDYNTAKAKHEAQKANLAELDFKIKSGQYLPREEIKQASATAYATIAQTMRSIPDNLERRLGISPDVAQEVGNLIDEAMADLAADLERIHTENAE